MIPELLLPLHIAAGTASVLSGAGALVFRKGERLHRASGAVFVAAMTVMALTAAVVGMENPGNAVAGGLVIYLIATSLVTVRRKEKRAGFFEIGAFIAALAFAGLVSLSAYRIASGQVEAANPIILGVTIFLSSVLAIAALGDLSVVLRRGVSGAQRIARHLWRMCFGLFIAVGSFTAQGADALPDVVPRVELLLSSMLLVLLVMTFWLVRVLFTGWYDRAGESGAGRAAAGAISGEA